MEERTYDVDKRKRGVWDITNRATNNTETVIDVYADLPSKCTCNNDTDRHCVHIIAAEMFEGEHR